MSEISRSTFPFFRKEHACGRISYLEQLTKDADNQQQHALNIYKMPKRSYDLSFGSDKRKSKKEKVDEEVEGESNIINVDRDLFDMGNSVSIRDNHIYFYGSVNTRNAIKLNNALRSYH